jgi:flagellar hook protein FlgE
MGLYSLMRTSVSGMAAQANRLSAISDNVANSNTVGYKSATVEFSTLVLQSGGQEYTAGNVESTTRYNVSQQGSLTSTTSETDLAIKGDGFFIVQGPDGATYLTRSGSFTRDGSGNLVNAAGFKLMGYSSDGTAQSVSNGTAGLTTINLGNYSSLQANPTTSGKLYLNLPSSEEATDAGSLPSANASDAGYAGKSSLVVYDNLGNEVTLDIYSTKSGDGTWEISVYNHADANSTDEPFPYSSAALTTETLSFGEDGQLQSTSATSLSIQIPNGAQVTLDMSGTSQLSSDYTVFSASADGNAPSEVDSVSIDSSGSVFVIYKNGEQQQAYTVAMAKVASP